MGYILAVHVPSAGLASLPLLFGLSPVFTPSIVVRTRSRHCAVRRIC
jgi:hypothetical protein